MINLANSNYVPDNAKSTYITHDERKLRLPKEIEKSGIFYETNLSANNIIWFIKDLILKMKLEVDEFNVYLAELPFDVNDKKTWHGEGIKVAKLFYFFCSGVSKK